jgi:hypothetical protein
MNIIGFYKNWSLVEKNGMFYVVARQERKVLFTGTEGDACKTFILLVANFINEDLTTKIEL